LTFRLVAERTSGGSQQNFWRISGGCFITQRVVSVHQNVCITVISRENPRKRITSGVAS